MQDLPKKKAKLESGSAAAGSQVFQMPESKPDLADLRLEPKEYFKYLKSQESHLSRHESDD